MSQQGTQADAIRVLDALLVHDSFCLRAYLERGTAHFVLGQYHEALRDFNQVLELHVDCIQGQPFYVVVTPTYISMTCSVQ